MSKPRRHHFVPVSYLNGFVEDEEGFLNIYSKSTGRWLRRKPKKVMIRKEYYRQYWVHDGIDKNILEKKLGAELEPKGLGALRKLIDVPDSLDEDDTVNILKYLAFQRIRVPRQVDMAKALVQITITQEVKKTSEGREALKHGKVVIKDSFRIEFMRTVLGALTPFFIRMIWEVIEVQAGLSFITSDSPVSYYNVDFPPPTEPGPAHYGTTVFFPINKQFLLVMRHPEYESGQKEASETLPKDLDVEDGVIEVQRGIVWDKEKVQRQNLLMLQLSQDLIVGESKAILERTVGTALVGHR